MKLMRRVRRVPGYRYARRRLVPKLRRSPTVRTVVHRLFDVPVKQRTPMDVSPGNVLAGVGVERLPVVIVVMLGLPAERVDGVVRDLAEVQLLSAAFRPVIVMDVPKLGAARAFGYPAELLINESSWTDETSSWDDYARAKLTGIFATYRASGSVTVGSDGLSQADRLVLTSLRPSK